MLGCISREGTLTICYVLCCKQKTAYEMRSSDWSSDVCSADRVANRLAQPVTLGHHVQVVEHVGGGQQQRARIGDAAACDVRRRTVHRLEDRRVQIGRASSRASVCQPVSILVEALS